MLAAFVAGRAVLDRAVSRLHQRQTPVSEHAARQFPAERGALGNFQLGAEYSIREAEARKLVERECIEYICSGAERRASCPLFLLSPRRRESRLRQEICRFCALLRANRKPHRRRRISRLGLRLRGCIFLSLRYFTVSSPTPSAVSRGAHMRDRTASANISDSDYIAAVLRTAASD